MTGSKYGKRVSSVIARMMKGETLCCQALTDGHSWWLEPSGKTVGPQTAQKVVVLPVVAASDDSLFKEAGFNTPQSYRYAGVA